jgi:hypothetical protein
VLARLNKPWLHFIVLGAIFYQLQSALLPESKPVVGPLSEARISLLKEQWTRSTGRNPSSEQIAKFIAVELDRDMLVQMALDLDYHLYDSIVTQRLILNMKFLQLAEGKSDTELFKEALEMQWHLDDEVVKRRLIQMVEQRLLASNLPLKPDAAEIEAVFNQRREVLKRPALYSIEHVFFPTERTSEVAVAITQIKDQDLDVKAAKKLGSPFLQGHHFINQTPDQLARNFGKIFVRELESELNSTATKANRPRWLGPVPSAYGVHYVWLAHYTPARDALLNEVKQQLLQDLAYSANKLALRCAIVAQRAKFDWRGGEQEAFDKEELCK